MQEVPQSRVSEENYISPVVGPPCAIAMEPVGHWHVTTGKALRFIVTDAATGERATVQDLTVEITRAGSPDVAKKSVADGQVVYKGNGVYSLEFTPSELAPYAFSVRYEIGGQILSSQAWVAEIARDGEEGIRRDVGGRSYVYQVRYNWAPGQPHANDTDAVSLVFEIMRGIQEGAEIGWAQPWLNTFDHVTDAVDSVVEVCLADGTLVDKVIPAYSGMGEYRAQRAFPLTEVRQGQDYRMTFRFTDPYNGAEVSNEKPYALHVDAPR